MRAKRVGLSLGLIAAALAFLMAFPLPAALGASSQLVSSSAAKPGALNEVGRAVGPTDLAPTRTTAEFGGVVTPPRAATLPSGASHFAGVPALAPAHPTSPQLLSSFAGINFASSGGFYPADAQVAQNGSYVFEIANEHGAITSTSGGTVYSTFSTTTFFGLNASHSVGNPQVLYDLLSRRWIVTAEDLTTDLLWIAVSQNSSPLSSYWTYYAYSHFSMPATQSMILPELGVTKTMVGLFFISYNATTGHDYGSIGIVFGKVGLLAGTLHFMSFGFLGSYPVIPARDVTANHTGLDILYAASTGRPSNSHVLTEYEIISTLHSGSSTTLTYAINGTGAVPLVPQPGTNTTNYAGNDGVESVSWSEAQVLWISYTVACKPTGDLTLRACLRVAGILTATNILQQDANTAVAGEYLYLGALTALTTGGGYLMVFAYGGSLTYPSIAVTGQNVSDAWGSHRGPIPVFSGTSYESTGFPGHWSGIQLSPAGTKMTAWGVAPSDNTAGWTTEVVHFAFY